MRRSGWRCKRRTSFGLRPGDEGRVDSSFVAERGSKACSERPQYESDSRIRPRHDFWEVVDVSKM